MDTSDVLARLQRLDEELGYLRAKQPLAPTARDYAQNQDLRKLVEYSMQIAAQICMDIANYFVSIYGLHPDRLEGIYTVLAREGLMTDELAQWLTASVGFRNILVHRYLTVDPLKVYEVWQHELDRFEEFARVVVDLLEKDQGDDR